MLLTAACALLASGCGGGSAFDNPETVANEPTTSTGQKLSFAYFQKCVQPVLTKPLPIDHGGVASTNTCAGSGCHSDANGSGGSLRIVADAAPADLAGTPDAIRATDMYRNFYSAQGAAVPGSPSQSRLLNKPLLRGVLHGGGLVFASEDDPNAKFLVYWISHPTPAGQDEFSTASNAMFTPPDPAIGTCNTP